MTKHKNGIDIWFDKEGIHTTYHCQKNDIGWAACVLARKASEYPEKEDD